jgi:hypothetical protein
MPYVSVRTSSVDLNQHPIELIVKTCCLVYVTNNRSRLGMSKHKTRPPRILLKMRKTSKDAHLTIQKVFVSDNNNESSESFAAAKYQRACTRLSEQCKTPSFPPVTTIEINELEDDEYVSIRAAAKYGASVFPIRIRETVALSGASSEFATHLGLILYNRGIFNYAAVVSATTESDRKRAELLVGASNALRMARTTFFRLIQNDVVEDKSEDSMPCILFAALSLNCLSLFFRSKNETRKANEAQRDVSDLLFILILS